MSSKDSITAASPATRSAGSRSATPGIRSELSAVEASTGSTVNGGDSSQHSAPGSPPTTTGPESKKRKSAPGSRGVANLTPEQLAKKRANDREAQRAIRSRTKLTIENLERRIRELTSQQPYQELQAALRAKEAVEAENADIKRRLASIVAQISPMITQSPPGLPVMPSPGQPFMPAAAIPTGPHHAPSAAAAAAVSGAGAGAGANNISTPSSAASPPSVDPYAQWNAGAPASSGGGPGVPAPPPPQAYQAQLSQQRHELAHGLELGSERLGLGFLLEQQAKGSGGAQDMSGGGGGGGGGEGAVCHQPAAYRQPPPQMGMTGQQQQQQQQHQYIVSTRDGGLPPPPPPPPPQSAIDPALQGPIDPALSSGHHSTPIKNCEPTCTLDSLLLEFLRERRQRAAEGFPAHDIIGPRWPNISSLLSPLREAHPLSKVFIDILHTFPNISQLPERVAVLYVMFLIMRWQIDPSQDNYDRLPDFMRPLPCQLYSPHAAWLDHLPFPAMRERLVHGYAPPDAFPFEHFFVPYTTTLSLNWPYEDTDTLLHGGPADPDELMINPVFERHLRKPENWSLGDAFARAFPMLHGTYNYRPDRSKTTPAGGGGGGGGGGLAAEEGKHGPQQTQS